MPSISGSNSKCKAGLFLAKRTLLSILHNKLNFSGLQIYCKKRERERERERGRERERKKKKKRKKERKSQRHTHTHQPTPKKRRKKKKEKKKKQKNKNETKKEEKTHVSTCPYFQCGRSESRLKPRWAALYRRAQISLPALASFQC